MAIYLDHHATTPVDPEVLSAMLPYFGEHFGNAASRVHQHGKVAQQSVAEARSDVASLVGAKAEEIVFTSGATEANNLAIKGALEGGGHVITQVTEHPSVLDPCEALEARGVEVTRVGVDERGRVDPAEIAAAMREDTRLVSVMRCNNEVGTVQDIAMIGEVARAGGALMHCDAAQGLGLLPLDLGDLPVDLVSMSAHKLYGPKGVGALYVRRGVKLAEQMHGGGHEGGLRSGTLNVPGVVGFGAAAKLMSLGGHADAERMRALRNRLHKKLAKLEAVRLFGDPDLDDATARHPGNLNMGFDYVESAGLLLALAPTVSVSSGAACSSTKTEPSHVLLALGADDAQAKSSLRFGVGRTTTPEEIDRVADAVVDAVTQLRERSPLWRQRGKAIDW